MIVFALSYTAQTSQAGLWINSDLGTPSPICAPNVRSSQTFSFDGKRIGVSKKTQRTITQRISRHRGAPRSNPATECLPRSIPAYRAVKRSGSQVRATPTTGTGSPKGEQRQLGGARIAGDGKINTGEESLDSGNRSVSSAKRQNLSGRPPALAGRRQTPNALTALATGN